ncbi:reverse transcriptase domain-containing protein, partial [Tanacetum coccineum]
MEFMFYICNCEENCQVKYTTCTQLDSALTWWNSHVKTLRIDAAYAMTWNELIKMMTEVYCPRNEIQNLENKLWNLTIKENDVVGCTQRFQKLALLCPKVVPGEEEKIKRYICGLPDNIQGNMTSTGTTRLQDTIRMANSLMDQKVRAIATRDADSK